MKFEAALERLEEIVGRMESGDLTLDESLAMFEEGVRLAKHCTGKLDAAERRIEILLKGEDGVTGTAPFEPPEARGRG